MKRVVYYLCLLFLSMGSLYASAEQKILPLDNPIYGDVDTLYLLEGLPVASQSRPWSLEEARMIAGRLPSALPEAERALRERIQATLEAASRWRMDDWLSIDLHLDVNAEGYAHTNPTDFTSYTDWLYSYPQRQPLLRARLDAAMDRHFFFSLEAQYGYGLTARQNLDPEGTAFYTIGDTTEIGAYNATDFPYFQGTITPSKPGLKISLYQHMFQSNVIISPNDWEYTWPKRAVFSLGGERWNVNYSRDRVSWGNSHIGNFLLDNHLDFLDYLRFSTFSPNFKFEGLYLFLNPYPNQCNTKDASEVIDKGVRMLLSHRLEFTVWNRLVFSVSEGLMYYNENGSVNFSYLNPSLIFHNLSDRNLFNAILTLEADYSFAKSWKFHTQFCLDQAKAYNEKGNNDEPDAMGVSVGISHARLWKQAVYTTDVEAALTLPALYRRSGTDFVISQRRIRLVTNEKAFYYLYDYLGFPYGGDAVVLQWQNALQWDTWKVEADLFSMLHGPVSMFTKLAEVNAAAFLSGDLGWTSVLSMKGTYRWDACHLTFVSRVDFVAKTTWLQSTGNFDGLSFDAQFVESIRYSW